VETPPNNRRDRQDSRRVTTSEVVAVHLDSRIGHFNRRRKCFIGSRRLLQQQERPTTHQEWDSSNNRSRQQDWERSSTPTERVTYKTVGV